MNHGEIRSRLRSVLNGRPDMTNQVQAEHSELQTARGYQGALFEEAAELALQLSGDDGIADARMVVWAFAIRCNAIDIQLDAPGEHHFGLPRDRHA
ncbi:hypothetical protein [Mycobacterium sp. URHB0044]|uniref:hypothetical protein n=1 Tax=Mycobacterium sp. URHB0044 TaxID=1380386 RepID=UPI0012DD8473|nr:hypothetical protein [Mycobacterium sp. URHB0044]